MKFTNNTGLPDHIAEVLKTAYENDNYDAPQGEKVISVTTLIGPAQKRVIERRHQADLSMDVLDTIPALLGQGLHSVLERGAEGSIASVPEQRLETLYDGWRISGKSDLYETKDHILLDYKASSVWAYIFGKKEWAEQLNILAWIRRRNGQPVKGLAIVLFCVDWRPSEAKKNPDYPFRVVNIPIPMWTLEETEAFVDERLKRHRAAMDGADIPCSDDERWAKPTTWAVIKDGNKRAASVYGTEEDAANAIKAGYHVEKRPGLSVRCAINAQTGTAYCAARPFCQQAANDPTLKQEENGDA